VYTGKCTIGFGTLANVMYKLNNFLGVDLAVDSLFSKTWVLIRLGDKVNKLFALISPCSVYVILPRGKNLTTPSVWFRESISKNGILFQVIRKNFDIGRKEGKFLSKSRSTCNLSCNAM
jgi:hypothetical protein